MADTMRGDLGDTPCDDCGSIGNTVFKHSGPLVPQGQTGHFDPDCWNKRQKEKESGLEPRPLGTSPK